MAEEFKLFVRNLPWSCDDNVLHETFAVHGEVTFSRLCTDKDTGKSRGFGFVSFATAEAAEAAQAALDKSTLDGREIEVKPAQAKGDAPAPRGDRQGGRQNTGARGACFAFQKGNCRFGDSCKFSHDSEGASSGGNKRESEESGQAPKRARQSEPEEEGQDEEKKSKKSKKSRD